MSTDTKIKTLIFNKLTQEQYDNADRVPTEFYLTPDTSIDSSEKGAANGISTLDANAKVPTEQLPVATTSTIGVVKPDGTTITVTEDGTISAVGGSGTGENDYVVETYTDEQGNWYRKYKSGWLEQGGISTGKTVTFLKTFANTNYTLTTACEYGSGDANNNIHVEYANNGKTTTGFSWATSIGTYVKSINWEAKGMGVN